MYVYTDAELEEIVPDYMSHFVPGATVVEMNKSEITNAMKVFGWDEYRASQVSGVSFIGYQEDTNGDPYLVDLIVVNNHQRGNVEEAKNTIDNLYDLAGINDLEALTTIEASEGGAYLSDIRHEMVHYVTRQMQFFTKRDNIDSFAATKGFAVGLKQLLNERGEEIVTNFIKLPGTPIDDNGDIIRDGEKPERNGYSKMTLLWDEAMAFKFGCDYKAKHIGYKLYEYITAIFNSESGPSKAELMDYAVTCVNAITRVEELIDENPENEGDLFFESIVGPEYILEEHGDPTIEKE